MPKNAKAKNAETTNANGFTLTLEWERETKGTVVYAEDVEDKPHKLYFRKDMFTGDFPKSVTVTVAF